MSISYLLPRAFVVSVEPAFVGNPGLARTTGCGWRACGRKSPAAQQQNEMSTNAVAKTEGEHDERAGVAASLGHPAPARRLIVADFMTEMQRDMDAMFEAFDMRPARTFGPTFFRPAPWRRHAHRRFVSPHDISEDTSKYTLKLEVPGYGKDDVKVSLDPSTNTVRITGQKEVKEGEAESRTSFTRSFNLPENVDLNQEFKARTEHGVLTLELPKAAEPTPPPVKEIPVEGH